MPPTLIETLPELYNRPGFLLRRAHQLCVAVFESSFESLDLTPAQYAVLIAIHESQPISQNDIARAVGMNKVTVSQVVQGLAERGWLLRQPSETDRRQLLLKLTKAGQKALKQTVPLAELAYREQMSAFESAEREMLCVLLQRIVDSLEPYARTPFEHVKSRTPITRGQ